MTDEQLGPVVDSWLKGTDAPPPDPVGSVNVAMANVHRTRQFRRWWPLPLIDRLLSPALGVPSRELEPRSIPATNGHSPAPIGRTRTMFSTPKFVAGAAALALTGTLLWSGVLTPQPEEQLPGAEAERTDFIIVNGTSTLSGGGAPTGDDSMSDPRVSGRVQLTNNYKMGTEDATGVQWGEYTLINEGGGWEGEWIGFYEGTPPDVYDETGKENGMVWASGTGDYEGWSYVANYAGNLFELDVKGLMYQDLIPPTVALGLLETETE